MINIKLKGEKLTATGDLATLIGEYICGLTCFYNTLENVGDKELANTVLAGICASVMKMGLVSDEFVADIEAKTKELEIDDYIYHIHSKDEERSELLS